MSTNSRMDPVSEPRFSTSLALAPETRLESATSEIESARRTATSSLGDVSESSPANSSSANLNETATARSDPTVENALVAMPFVPMGQEWQWPLPPLPLRTQPPLPQHLHAPLDAAGGYLHEDADCEYDSYLRRGDTLLPVRPWKVTSGAVVWGCRKSALVSFIGAAASSLEETARSVDKMMGLLATRAARIQGGDGAHFCGDRHVICAGLAGEVATKKSVAGLRLTPSELKRGSAGRLRLSRIFSVSASIAVAAMILLQRRVVLDIAGLADDALELLEQVDCTAASAHCNAVERRLLARGIRAMARVDSSSGMADDELSRQRRRVDCFLAGLYPPAVVGLATQASLMLSLSSLDPRDAMAVRPTAQALQQLDSGRNVRLRTDDGSSSASSYVSSHASFASSSSSECEFHECEH